jgi:hypothetical protein
MKRNQIGRIKIMPLNSLQIGVSYEDMVKHYGARWVWGLGHKHFTSYIKTRKLKQTACICILSADSEMTRMAPSDEDLVGGIFPETRKTKSPWVIPSALLSIDAMCGENLIVDLTHSFNRCDW